MVLPELNRLSLGVLPGDLFNIPAEIHIFSARGLVRNRTIMRKGIMIRLNKKARLVSKQDKINPKDAASLLSSA